MVSYLQAARYIASHPKVRAYVASKAYSAAKHYLTPPRTPRKSKKRPGSNQRSRRSVKRRLNFNVMPMGRRSKTAGVPASRQGRFHVGANRFEAKDLAPYPKGTKGYANLLKEYQLKGYVDTVEVTGQVNDPDCVYIGHVAQCNLQTMYNLLRALVRKLLMKCVKYDAINANAEIPGYLFDDTGTVYKIVLLQRNRDTDAVTVLNTWFSAGNDTIQTIAQAFINDFINYANGFAEYSASYKQELFKFQVYQKDGNVTSFWNFQGELIFDELVYHYHMQSTMKMQNRSLASGGGTTTEDVSNNPLIGRIYQMNGLPLTRDLAGRFGGIKNNGVCLYRGAEMPADSQLKEPPSPGYFVNIKYSAPVKLLPGQIKYNTITVFGKKKLLSFLKMLRWDEDADSRVYYNSGPFSMVALEDAINVNSTEKIQLAYECNRVTAGYFTEKRSHYSQGKFDQYAYSNTT